MSTPSAHKLRASQQKSRMSLFYRIHFANDMAGHVMVTNSARTASLAARLPGVEIEIEVSKRSIHRFEPEVDIAAERAGQVSAPEAAEETHSQKSPIEVKVPSDHNKDEAESSDQKIEHPVKGFTDSQRVVINYGRSLAMLKLLTWILASSRYRSYQIMACCLTPRSTQREARQSRSRTFREAVASRPHHCSLLRDRN